MFIVLMGVAGSGKSTVGRRLASVLGWPFHDGDDYHPPENRAKMARGEALDDDDREPWLARLRRLIEDLAAADRSAVIACSALKQRYREVLTRGRDDVQVVYLRADEASLRERLAGRRGHFFPSELLASQLAALEVPEQAIVVDAGDTPAEITAEIRRRLRLPPAEPAGQR